MSNLQNIQNVPIRRMSALESALPAWRLVLVKELADLWIGGKGLILILAYSLLLGGMAYISSVNAELDMLPPQETVSDLLWNSMAVSTFLGLIIGADAFSGERDRGTFESLLLTPASRSHIIIAKLLAGISVWPVAYIVAIPYLVVLAQGSAVLSSALFWGAVTGTILVIGYTGMGMLISFWSGSNKVSYFVSLGIYALLLIPAELPGDTVEFVGQFLQWINPIASTNYFLANQLDHGTTNEFSTWLLSSMALALLSVGVLLGYVSKKLRLEAGTNIRFWEKLRRRIGFLVMVVILMVSGSVSQVHAFQADQAKGYSISVDNEYYYEVKIGEKIEVGTVITNNTSLVSPQLVVAMNVINLDDAGAVVDPEDWSPERTQYINALESGQSATLDWVINPILEGNFMVYMVLIPTETARLEKVAHPVASPGIQLTVAPFTGFRSSSILPIVIAEPLILLAITYFIYRRRRQQIDLGGSS